MRKRKANPMSKTRHMRVKTLSGKSAIAIVFFSDTGETSVTYRDVAYGEAILEREIQDIGDVKNYIEFLKRKLKTDLH